MKFTLFALIGALCLVASNAALLPETEIDEFSQRWQWVDTASVWFKGIGCFFHGLADLKQSLVDYIFSIENCGEAASSDVMSVVHGCESIISTIDQLLHFQQQICNKTSTTKACLAKLGTKLKMLQRQVQSTLAAIHQVTNIPSDAATCIVTATHTLEDTFTGYPTWVKECSQWE